MATRKGTRRGRPAKVLSPRDLPSGLRLQIEAEAVYGGLSARVLYDRHGLGALGVNSRTFRKYVIDRRREEAQSASRKAQGDRTRPEVRRGRPADGLSPRDLPKATQSRIKSEAIRGRLSAREIHARHNLGVLGVNFNTFRQWVAGFRKGRGLSFQMPSITVKAQTAARAVLLLLESRMTSRGVSSVVAIMARDRLGVVPVGAPKGSFSARFTTLAGHMGAFLASLCKREEAKEITRSLCAWKYGEGWAGDSGKSRKSKGGNR